MMPGSPLRGLRMLLAVNLALFVILAIDAFVRAKGAEGSGGSSTGYDTLMLAGAVTALVAYIVGLVGLWFAKGCGRIAFCVFIALAIAVEDPGETARLSLVIGDLHTLSSGLILGVAFFVGGFATERAAVKDVFS